MNTDGTLKFINMIIYPSGRILLNIAKIIICNAKDEMRVEIIFFHQTFSDTMCSINLIDFCHVIELQCIEQSFLSKLVSMIP